MGARAWAVAVALAGGCGFDTTGSLPGDGPADAAPPADATPLGPFGEPSLIGELAFLNAVNDDPTLTADLREIYFNSNRPGGIGGDDIWRAERDDAESQWSAPEVVAELSSIARDTDPEVSPDGLVMLLSSTRFGTLGEQDVWLSTRSTRGDQWSEPVQINVLNSARIDAAVANAGNMERIILSSNRPGGTGEFDLYESTKREETWSSPVPIERLLTTFNETNPFLTPDGLELYFDSNRPGDAGDDDLWLASRESLDGQLGEPEPLRELNTQAREMDPWVSPDRRVIVFSSDRNGSLDFYIARR